MRGFQTPVVEQDRWLSSQEAAAMLGVGRSKFVEIRKSGRIAEHRLGYRTVRFSLHDLRRYMLDRPKPTRNRG